MAIGEEPTRRHQAQTGATTVRRVGRRPERVTTAQPPDIFHVARDEDYLRKLQEEAEFWDSRPDTLLSKTPGPRVLQYQNERLTGDHNRQWFEVIGEYGEYKRGCVLGAGPGDVESILLDQHDQLHLTVYDISREALARLQARLEQEFPGRTEIREDDLNFVTLPANTYDLLVSHSCMHHILNLEHLAFQINQCLTSDGYFFMKDTVGESYFQFSDEKKRLVQAFRNATHDNPGPHTRIQWADRNDWPYSPFESARSGEILEVFARYLDEVQVRTASAFLQLALSGVPPKPSRARSAIFRIRGMGRVLRAARAVREKLLKPKVNSTRAYARGELRYMLDRILCDTGYLKPGTAFAIYQKRH